MSELRRWDLYIRDMLEARERFTEAADGLHQGAKSVEAISDPDCPFGILTAAVR